MKKPLLLTSAICLLTSYMVFGQTSIPAGNVNGTWTLGGSPYNIQGNIQIVNGDSLIIQPGVSVIFQGTYKLAVQGKLKAIGTVTDTIIFTAANTTNGWTGIQFANTPATNDTSKIKYCKLQYGNTNNGGALYFASFSKAIISNCRVNNNTVSSYGGGIYCFSSSPTLTNNIIINNTSSSDGGGIYCSSSSSPIMNNNVISYNNAYYDGGGICCSSSSPSITGNTISNNNASSVWGIGGGIYCSSSSPNISNNSIINNTSTGSAANLDQGGGGIYCYGSSPNITNNTISNNTANNYGGGIYCYSSSSPSITNNTISNNTANNYGGGISCNASSSTTKIINNTITNNTATAGGGGIFFYSSSPKIYNCTISNNKVNNTGSNYGGGALFCTTSSNPVFQNCILYGNYATSGNGHTCYINSNGTFDFCNVEGSNASFYGTYTGSYTNNIDVDPLFVSPSGGSGTGFNGVTADWSLQNISPCINAGYPNGMIGFYPATDKAGNPRVVVCYIDMGAYEYQNGAPFLLSVSKTNVPCNGGTGTATATVSNGSSPYTYSWTNGQTTSTATLINGTYTVTVNDANSCIRTATVSITQPSALTSGVSSTQTNCSSNTGTATVIPGGGVIPYSYLWNGGQTTSVATGFGVGNYTITITDGNSCSKTTTVNVTYKPNPNVTTSTTQSNCSSPTGTATANASGGTSPYTYLWSGGQTTSVATGFSANSYTITITDANGCTKTTTATVTNKPSPGVTIATNQNVSCNGLSDGSANANPSGGSSPYTFSWSNLQTTQTATGLSATTFSVTVTDANGCTGTATKNITQPNVLAATASVVVSASCGHADGGATVTLSGGTTPYTYLWSNNATTQQANNIFGGHYSVTVTDAKGCTTSASVTINNSIPPAQPPICAVTVDSLSKYNVIVWDKTSYPNADTFFVYRDTANNAYGFIGKVPHDSLSQFIDTARTKYAANGDPNSTTWKYKIAVKDTCGNLSAKSPYHKTLFIQNNSGNFNWNDYLIEGQSVPIPTLQNYLFQRDNTSNGSWQTIATLSASSLSYTDGAYSTYQNTATWRVRTVWNISCTPTIINPKNPELETTTINTTRSNTFRTITALTISVSVTNNASSCSASDGSLTATVSGGVAPYTFLWNPGGQTTAAAVALAVGSYTVTVKDVHNSTAIATATVNCPNGVSEFSLENSASVYPNPNNGNFILDLQTINSKSVNVKMYDVFGRLVYEKTCSEKKTEMNCNLAQGIYQLQVQTKKGSVSKKIIIQ